MKVLIISYSYYPRVGGIETVSKILSEGFLERGISVSVLTKHSGDDFVGGVRVYRASGVLETIKIIKSFDVVLQSNISLESLIFSIFLRKKIVVVLHTWVEGGGRFKRAVKLLALKFVRTKFAVSQALASSVPGCKVIKNPYKSSLFKVERQWHGGPSVRLVYFGRLIDEKGVDVLLNAVQILIKSGRYVVLKIIGEGAAETDLRNLVVENELDEVVTFCGTLTGELLVRELQRADIAVIPSRWQEPFGLVAIEAMACGLYVIASNAGGLPEAVGPAGGLFENGNHRELARMISDYIDLPSERKESISRDGLAWAHEFSEEKVVDAYLKAIDLASGS